jgi:hypothetical protein
MPPKSTSRVRRATSQAAAQAHKDSSLRAAVTRVDRYCCTKHNDNDDDHNLADCAFGYLISTSQNFNDDEVF